MWVRWFPVWTMVVWVPPIQQMALDRVGDMNERSLVISCW